MSVKRSNGLSKTSLLKGMQCGKALYLYKNNYQERDPVSKEQQDKFDRGHRVGLMARQLFPGGKDCTPPTIFQYDQSIAATKALVMQQFPVIYEAAFKFEGLMVATDILCCNDGKWYGYEVKSSGKITNTYLLDAAIQYYVITNSGLQLEDFFLVHINTGYVRKGDLSLQELFRVVSVKDEILALQETISDAVERAREVLLAEKAPDIETGIHCFKPYPCDFLGSCWKGLEKNPLMQLAGVSIQDKVDWIKKGILRMEDIPAEFLTRNRLNAQLLAHQTGGEYVDMEALKSFFNDIQYPLYFFDIEAYQPAIPEFEDTFPFQPIPFQFSAHYIEKKNGPLKAFEYIVPPGEDGRKAFVASFLESTEKPGQIIVFNTLLEKGVLYHLGKLFPEYAADIRQRLERLVDLEIPFKQDWFYHPGMQGGYSMKSILPALVPELSYEHMTVKDGADAMYVYQQLMNEQDKSKRIRALQDLLSYCQMDTLGLYEVFCYLEDLIA
jgi:Domain of unknown function(DUF2779)